MRFIRINAPFRKADEYERLACLRLMGWSQQQGYTALFRCISRLGDGVLWYVTIGLVALHDPSLAGQCLITGLSCTLLYKLLKHVLTRERPFITHATIESRAPVLDRYSFPSGHTLHAVCFTVLLSATLPTLGVVLWPFTCLVALSRITLGLHYPSDVLAGAVVGALIAFTSLAFWPVSGA